MNNYYLDSSAILKFIFEEKESSYLRKNLRGNFLTSEISRVEVIRSVLRHQPELHEYALAVLRQLKIIKIKSAIVMSAENFPAHIKLGSLDALQLASAMQIYPASKTVVTYDKEMAIAAQELGFEVLSPGE
jgi:predicted nucleic acid-binding protein